MAEPSFGYLYVRQPTGQAIAYPLSGDGLLIGSGETADIVIDHPSVADEHARLHFQGQFVGIEDLSSEQGTVIDNNRLRPSRIYVLTDDARIRLGVVFARWVPQDGELPADAEIPGREPGRPGLTRPLRTGESTGLTRPLRTGESTGLTRPLRTGSTGTTRPLRPEGSTGTTRPLRRDSAYADYTDEEIEAELSPMAEDTAREMVAVDDERPAIKLSIDPPESGGEFRIVLSNLGDAPMVVTLATGSRFIDLVYDLISLDVEIDAGRNVTVPLKVTCTAEQWQRRPFKVQAQVGGEVAAQATAVLVAGEPERRIPRWMLFTGAGAVLLVAFWGMVLLVGLLARPTDTNPTPDGIATQLVVIVAPTASDTPEPSNTPEATTPAPTERPVIGRVTSTPTLEFTPTFTPTPTATLRYADGLLAYKTGQVGNESLVVAVPGEAPITVISGKDEIQVLAYTGQFGGVLAVRVADAGEETLWLVQPDGTLIQQEVNEGWDALRSVNWSPDASFFVVEADVNGETGYFVFDTASGELGQAVTLVAATVTLTPTQTRTPTPTVTPTITRTPTITPSRTVTPSPTLTVTLTPTATRTSTPTRTPTITAAPIRELPTVTPSNTIPPTATQPVAPLPTATATP